MHQTSHSLFPSVTAQTDGKVNVLLVDDEPANLMALEAVLDNLGLNLIKASSGEEALRRLLVDDFAVILLDVQMHGMDGFETAAMIHGRKRSRHTPIIFLTAYGDAATPVSKGYAVGAVDYLVKPLMPEVLKSKVAVFVELSRQSQIVKQQARQLEIRARQQEAVARLGQHALAGPDLHELMEEAVTLVGETLEVERCQLFELLADGSALLLRAGRGWKGEQIGRTTISVGTGSQAGFLLQANRPTTVENYATEMRFTPCPLMKEQGMISGISVVIPGTDRPFGTLGADTIRPRNFTSDDMNFLQAMANVLASSVERKRAEEKIRRFNAALETRVTERTVQLEAAVKELEAFSYSVSHDLRAPLRVIDGFSRILMKKYQMILPPESQELLQLVCDNVQQMGRLIDDLLRFSQLSRLPLQKEPVDSAALVRNSLQDLQAQHEGRQVEMAVADLPSCTADLSLLRQVWVNLLSNAFKYTRQREVTRIEVGFRKENGEQVYFVRDNGTGFNMRYASKLFGVFQRLHRAEEYEGTGVGLALVQRIVHRHGGRVWAEAEVDKGAVFSFTLPEDTKNR